MKQLPSPKLAAARRLAPLLALVLAAVGCVSTFKNVTPISNSPPPAVRPTVLALGEINITDPRWSDWDREGMVIAFERGVEDWCARHQGLSFYSIQPPTNTPPAESLVLRGTIREVNPGSSDARFWVGMGAGKAVIRGQFTLDSSDGTTQLRFNARNSYLGGTGIGGGDFLSLDELMTQLGKMAAQTADKWVKNQKL